MTRPRNRAAQDATLINLRALKKRVAALERQVRSLRAARGARATAEAMTLLIWIAIVALVVLGIVGLAVWLFVQVVADIHRQEADLDYWADAPAANKERADA